MGKKWSEEELKILSDNCTKNISELIILLPMRTKSAILNKIDKSNFTKRKNKIKNVTKDKKKVNWTKDEIKILLECETIEEAKENLPHCSEKRILYKARRLRKSFYKSEWTIEEEDILKLYYRNINFDMNILISKLPKRSKSAILSKAYKLRLDRFDKNYIDEEIVKMYLEGQYPAEIARIVGLSSLTVTNKLKNSSVSYKRVILKKEKHPRWKGLSTEIAEARRSDDYKNWRIQVFQRDCFTCVICRCKDSGSFEAHHIENFSNNVDKRFDVDNGLTMCKECHSITEKDSFHSLYGTKDNSLEQLQEYTDTKRKYLSLPDLDISKYIEESKVYVE